MIFYSSKNIIMTCAFELSKIRSYFRLHLLLCLIFSIFQRVLLAEQEKIAMLLIFGVVSWKKRK